MKRRQVLKSILFAGGGVAAARALPIQFAYAEDEVITSDHPTAKALKYVANAADAASKPDKAGVKGSDQNCANCQFAVGAVKKVDGQEGEYVPCQLFQKKLVNSAGWCSGWAPKMT